MKKILIFIIIIFLANTAYNQENQIKSPKVGWYIMPEFGAIFLEGSVGNTFGISMGTKIWKNRIKVGIMGYSRSGPTNSATFDYKLTDGMTYKGQTNLKLRADWGAFGGTIAPTFKIKNIEIDIPISFGGVLEDFIWSEKIEQLRMEQE